MTQPTTEERRMEIQEEEQEDALESLLKKVSLDDPLEVPISDGKFLEISKEQFIKYYLPRNATTEEAFHCFNQTRMAGLSPLVAGECHYPRFSADQPLRLFTGYPVYLRKAYENGLIYPKCEFQEDENGKPISVITTLYIKGREEPFVWQTWYSEVEGQTKGQPNWRWKKAPHSQLRKCGVVDAIRYSGLLVHMNLPLAMEEMPDAIEDGYRTLTQEQIDRWKDAPEKMLDKQELEKAMLGEVTAEAHQIDMSSFRKTYFKALKERGMFQNPDDTEKRREWQMNATGKAHNSDWGVEQYAHVMELLAAIPKIEPETTETEGDQEDPQKEKEVAYKRFVDQAVNRFATEADARDWISERFPDKPPDELSIDEWNGAIEELAKLPVIATDDSAPPQTQEGEEEGQDEANESTGQTGSEEGDTASADEPEIPFESAEAIQEEIDAKRSKAYVRVMILVQESRLKTVDDNGFATWRNQILPDEKGVELGDLSLEDLNILLGELETRDDSHA